MVITKQVMVFSTRNNMPQGLSALPPPPQGQSGVSFNSLKGLPPPPQGQKGVTLTQASQATSQTPPNLWDFIASQAKAGFQQGEAGYQQALNAQNPVDLLEGSAKLAAGVVNTVTAPLSPVLAPVGKAVGAIADKISDIPAVQKFANSSAGDVTSRVAEDISNLDTIVGGVAGVKGVPEAGAAITNRLKVTPEESAAMDTAKVNAQSASTAAQVDKVATEWQKPAGVQTASFNKTRDALSVAPDSPKFLAQQGITPSSVVEDGRYATADAAQSLRDTAAKMSTDTLRPSLQMADYSTPKTPVTELTSNAIDALNKEKGITPGDKETITANIQKEASALQRKYPDGMSLTDMHDEKITYANNGGFHPLKSASDNNTATANRVYASALQKAVETKAPPGVPVKDFNSYLSKYYKAADYLDTLDTKKAPLSFGEKVRGAAIKYGSAAVAEHFGGGVVSAFAGYSVGKAIEHAIENLTPSMKSTFIRNLEVTNPEAFTKVQEYLKSQTSGNTGTPRLPAATNRSPIPLAASKDTASVAPYAAKTKLPTVNPKTGRMQTTYTSSPK